jgi:rhodanese-related sulfurtransferase
MKKVSARKLQRLREEQEDVVIINVMGDDDEFRRHHIPGSEMISMDDPDFVDEVRELAGGKHRPVVVYCAGGEECSPPEMARRLEEAGFREVYHFDGGIEEWEEAGLPIEGEETGHLSDRNADYLDQDSGRLYGRPATRQQPSEPWAPGGWQINEPYRMNDPDRGLTQADPGREERWKRERIEGGWHPGADDRGDLSGRDRGRSGGQHGITRRDRVDRNQGSERRGAGRNRPGRSRH